MAFSEVFVQVLCRLHSDPNPILLRCRGLPQVKGPRPFRFEAAWIVHDQYSQVVDDAWNNKKGRPLDTLPNVRDKSIIFNREVFV